ncbi:hypothetical protein GBA52_008545 [Prunus armeniaca]|nr:hypothetical protein GBA52_008545 [Prunus armeniaca]
MLATGPRDGTIVSVVKTCVNKVELATGPQSDTAACIETALSATKSRGGAVVASPSSGQQGVGKVWAYFWYPLAVTRTRALVSTFLVLESLGLRNFDLWRKGSGCGKILVRQVTWNMPLNF